MLFKEKNSNTLVTCLVQVPEFEMQAYRGLKDVGQTAVIIEQMQI